jgi:hypothetical protein
MRTRLHLAATAAVLHPEGHLPDWGMRHDFRRLRRHAHLRDVLGRPEVLRRHLRRLLHRLRLPGTVRWGDGDLHERPLRWHLPTRPCPAGQQLLCRVVLADEPLLLRRLRLRRRRGGILSGFRPERCLPHRCRLPARPVLL